MLNLHYQRDKLHTRSVPIII